jgi:glucose/arabinose dehydrogenase
MNIFLRVAELVTLSAAAIVASGCSGASSFFYVNKHTQAIERDTVTASGMHSVLQNPQDSVNGIIHLAPVESLELRSTPLTGDPVNHSVNLPQGFTASVVATGLGRVRDIVVRADGTIFYSDFDGRLMALQAGGTPTVLHDGLSSPHGIEMHDNALYYTDETHVYRFDFTSPTAITGTHTLLTDRLPTGGVNFTRTIRWLPSDRKFYIAIGSTTNKDPENDNQTATVQRMDEKGGRPAVAIYGGLRNTVAMDVNPATGELWGIDNGTELLSPDLPPTEVNILRLSRFYGWPYYYSQNFRDPDYMDADTVKYPRNAVPPVIELESHAEVLDMEFCRSSALGADWNNAILMTFHNPDRPKLVRLRATGAGDNPRVADFMTGFVDSQGATWGQPVGVTFGPDGKSIYVTDDRAGAIYKIVHQ